MLASANLGRCPRLYVLACAVVEFLVRGLID